eukprot:363953-Chlamydomonas_euryale.AAC.2
MPTRLEVADKVPFTLTGEADSATDVQKRAMVGHPAAPTESARAAARLGDAGAMALADAAQPASPATGPCGRAGAAAHLRERRGPARMRAARRAAAQTALTPRDTHRHAALAAPRVSPAAGRQLIAICYRALRTRLCQGRPPGFPCLAAPCPFLRLLSNRPSQTPRQRREALWQASRRAAWRAVRCASPSLNSAGEGDRFRSRALPFQLAKLLGSLRVRDARLCKDVQRASTVARAASLLCPHTERPHPLNRRCSVG